MCKLIQDNYNKLYYKFPADESIGLLVCKTKSANKLPYAINGHLVKLPTAVSRDLHCHLHIDTPKQATAAPLLVISFMMR